MAGLTLEEKLQALLYAKRGADFMFIPSANLCAEAAMGSPETIGINKTLVAILLTKKPIRLDTRTVVKYCMGTLDRNNTWLLDHGDIKVVPPRFKMPELTKDMEENNLEENKDE